MKGDLPLCDSQFDLNDNFTTTTFARCDSQFDLNEHFNICYNLNFYCNSQFYYFTTFKSFDKIVTSHLSDNNKVNSYRGDVRKPLKVNFTLD